jgi:non-heme chloroperoxidase
MHLQHPQSGIASGGRCIATADGTRLFVRDWGHGPAVVFSHGWMLGGDIWEYQVTALLARGFRCIAVDRRGCGLSDQPATGYDFDTFADDLAAVIAQLGLGDITLVGHSMGCGEIVRYFARHGSGRVARTALIAPTTPCIARRPDNPQGQPPEFFEQMVAALLHDRPGFMAAGAPGFFGVEVSPAMLQWVIGLAMRASPIATAAMQRAQAATDFRPDMAAVDVPCLVLHGDADTGVPLDLCGARTAAMIPGARLAVYEGAGHGLLVTHKDRLNEDLVRFILG